MAAGRAGQAIKRRAALLSWIRLSFGAHLSLSYQHIFQIWPLGQPDTSAGVLRFCDTIQENLRTIVACRGFQKVLIKAPLLDMWGGRSRCQRRAAQPNTCQGFLVIAPSLDEGPEA